MAVTFKAEPVRISKLSIIALLEKRPNQFEYLVPRGTTRSEYIEYLKNSESEWFINGALEKPKGSK